MFATRISNVQRLLPENRHRNHHRGIRGPEDPDRFSEGVPILELRDDIRITDTAPIVRRMEDSDMADDNMTVGAASADAKP